jgi:hypothetical protein
MLNAMNRSSYMASYVVLCRWYQAQKKGFVFTSSLPEQGAVLPSACGGNAKVADRCSSMFLFWYLGCFFEHSVSG